MLDISTTGVIVGLKSNVLSNEDSIESAVLDIASAVFSANVVDVLTACPTRDDIPLMKPSEKNSPKA